MSSRMPEKERSSRTTWVKREEWGFAESERGAKSATAMRGFSMPRPVPARNQSWEEAGEEKKRRERKEKNIFATEDTENKEKREEVEYRFVTDKSASKLVNEKLFSRAYRLGTGTTQERTEPKGWPNNEPKEHRQECLCHKRVCATSFGQAQVEVENDVDVRAGIIAGKGWEPVNAEQCALGRIIKGKITTGLREANIFNRAIAVDGEIHDGVSAARGADGRINGGLDPVLVDSAFDGFNVPAVAAGEIAAALALDGYAAGGSARDGRVARGEIHLAALAVRNRVIGWGCFALESFGRLGNGGRF